MHQRCDALCQLLTWIGLVLEKPLHKVIAGLVTRMEQQTPTLFVFLVHRGALVQQVRNKLVCRVVNSKHGSCPAVRCARRNTRPALDQDLHCLGLIASASVEECGPALLVLSFDVSVQVQEEAEICSGTHAARDGCQHQRASTTCCLAVRVCTLSNAVHCFPEVAASNSLDKVLLVVTAAPAGLGLELHNVADLGTAVSAADHCQLVHRMMTADTTSPYRWATTAGLFTTVQLRRHRACKTLKAPAHLLLAAALANARSMLPHAAQQRGPW
mmetsp:Transcript_35620/g.82749  ORF Transcript_35620/g.82749 Transcript_35620/m.82749 type:complete len:271 (-) Transcript_35620:70-882(-)